jgi:hypothetical protein
MIFLPKAEHMPKHVGYNIIRKSRKIYYNALVHRDDGTLLRTHNVTSTDFIGEAFCGKTGTVIVQVYEILGKLKNETGTTER